MPTKRIALIGSFNQRGMNAATTLDDEVDQRFSNCIFNVVDNPVTGGAKVYVEKRPGWGLESTVSTGLPATGLIQPQAFNAAFSAFGATNSAVYVGSVHVGNITGRGLHFTETLISASSYVLIKSSEGSGWYYASGAKDVTSYTGHTSSGSATVSTLSVVTGLYPGQLITGNTIGSGARISTVTASTSTITLTVTSSATSTGVALTKEPVAKILSANFVSSQTYHSAFVPMDGFHFYATDDGNVRGSDLNSITAYTASNFIAANSAPDPLVALERSNNLIAAWGTGSMEVFYNAGNAAGSPLSVIKNMATNIGALDQRSLARLGDDIYFVTGARFGEVGVMRTRQLTGAQEVSTPLIRRILGTIAASGGQIYASAFQLGGYNYLALTAITSGEQTVLMLLESGDFLLLESGDNIILDGSSAETATFNRMLVLNADLRIWSEWDCSEATYIVGVAGGTNKLLAASRVDTDGEIYTINPASQGELRTDDGVSYTMEIRTSKLDFGTDKRKTVHSVTLIADTESSGSATLEYSDDDYATWTTAGTFDMTQKIKKITRLGAHRGARAWRLRHSSDAPFRGEALEFDYTVGLS